MPTASSWTLSGSAWGWTRKDGRREGGGGGGLRTTCRRLAPANRKKKNQKANPKKRHGAARRLRRGRFDDARTNTVDAATSATDANASAIASLCVGFSRRSAHVAASVAANNSCECRNARNDDAGTRRSPCHASDTPTRSSAATGVSRAHVVATSRADADADGGGDVEEAAPSKRRRRRVEIAAFGLPRGVERSDASSSSSSVPSSLLPPLRRRRRRGRARSRTWNACAGRHAAIARKLISVTNSGFLNARFNSPTGPPPLASSPSPSPSRSHASPSPRTS